MVYLCGNEATWEIVTLDLWVFLHWYRHQKRNKEPNVKVLLGALLFGCNVSSIVRNLCVFRTKNTWKGERKPAKILERMETESNRKYLKNLSSLELHREPAFA